MSISLLFDIFVFLMAACVVVPLASRFKLGSVLGYLAAGIVIGPFGLALIGHSENIMHFAEFGVVMMLFIIGLEMEPAVLWRLRRSVIGLGGLQVLLTMAAFTAVGIWLGYGWQVSVAVSMALALSSTALVIQMLQEKHLMNTTVGQSSFAVLLFQDIAVIPFLVLIPLIAASAGMQDAATMAHHSIITTLPAWGQALAVALAIAAIILAGRYLLYYLFREVARTRLREVFVALSLALVVGVALLMQWVGASPALGVFIAGVVLANSEYRHSLENDIEPFKGLLLGLFFISVGMGIDFDLFEQHPQTVLALVLGLIAIKAIVLFTLGSLFGLKSHNDYMFALALSQGGEFGFVLLKYIAGTALLPEMETNMLVLVVALSIASTPIIMLYYSHLIAPRLMFTRDPKEFDAIDEQHPIIIAGFGRFGQVIGRFLAGKGVAITVLENDPDQINLLRKFGYKGYYGDATRPDMLHKAGAERARVLIVAVDDPKSCLDIVRRAKEGFPHLAVFARAHNRQHAYELNKLGVEYFKRELFDSSLTMAQEVMVHLGRDRDDIAAKAKIFQHHDEATLRESFAFFENEPMLVDFAKTRREELERILRSDVEDHDRHNEEMERKELREA